MVEVGFPEVNMQMGVCFTFILILSGANGGVQTLSFQTPIDGALTIAASIPL